MTVSLTQQICTPTRHVTRRTPMAILAVWSQRRKLARLDATSLKDMGISADQARAEAARPFWDLPS